MENLAPSLVVLEVLCYTKFLENRGGDIFLNGVFLEEPCILEPTWMPEGCLFLTGDNRNGSDDSRGPLRGFADTRSVIGRVFCLLLPAQTKEGSRHFQIFT